MKWTCSHCGKTVRVRREPVHCSCGGAQAPCIHLGEETGLTIDCTTCKGGPQPVMNCAKHGDTMLRRPIPRAGAEGWDGKVCFDAATGYCADREVANG